MKVKSPFDKRHKKWHTWKHSNLKTNQMKLMLLCQRVEIAQAVPRNNGEKRAEKTYNDAWNCFFTHRLISLEIGNKQENKSIQQLS